jgi:hypothetical protein
MDKTPCSNSNKVIRYWINIDRFRYGNFIFLMIFYTRLFKRSARFLPILNTADCIRGNNCLTKDVNYLCMMVDKANILILQKISKYSFHILTALIVVGLIYNYSIIIVL